MSLTKFKKGEIQRLRGQGYDFKTIARMACCTPDQARNVWYSLPPATRAALTTTLAAGDVSDGRQQTEAYRVQLAKRALQREITLAREERATAPLFKVSPLLW